MVHRVGRLVTHRRIEQICILEVMGARFLTVSKGSYRYKREKR